MPFAMTRTELRLKRERMAKCFTAAKAAFESIEMPCFLSYQTALGALREGECIPYDEDISIGIFCWDLAKFQRGCGDATAVARDEKFNEALKAHNFETIQERVEAPEGAPESEKVQNASPRTWTGADSWTYEEAVPIVYKYYHKEVYIKLDVVIFNYQFGQMWDWTDGGAETCSGWRYTPFVPQEIEFEKVMTYTMPALQVEEHYGKDWFIPNSRNYQEQLVHAKNRCDVLEIHKYTAEPREVPLPKGLTWEEFKAELREIRKTYAKAMVEQPRDPPKIKLDLLSGEFRPVHLMEVATVCKEEGNVLLKESAKKALRSYDEGVEIMDKCRAVILEWRLVFRHINEEKKEKDRKHRGLKSGDMDPDPEPAAFVEDVHRSLSLRNTCLNNGAQACMQLEDWEGVYARTSQVLDNDSKCVKALYRRGIALAHQGKKDKARADFWALLRACNFENKDALRELLKLNTMEEIKIEMRKQKTDHAKQENLKAMLNAEPTDQRVEIGEFRRMRYLADMEQRQAEKLSEIDFDTWVLQYEWRYDADKRNKVREQWGQTFSRAGPAPLPVESWEVDYMVHKEMKRRQYLAYVPERRNPQPVKPLAPLSRFEKSLELDEEDQQILKDKILKKGYNYFW